MTSTTREGLEHGIRLGREILEVPVGNVTADVDAYFCSRSPDCCDGVATGEPLPATFSLEARIMAWTAGLTLGGGEALTLVDPEEATERSARCLGCVNNVAYAAAGCCGQAAPNAELNTTLAGLRQGQDTRFSGELRGCRVLGVDVRTAIWLPLETIPTAPDEQLPSFCWNRGRRTEETPA